MIGLFGVLFFIPIYLQQYQNLGAFHTGLLLLPQAIGMAVAMPVAGQLYDRFGARWPASIGLTIAAVGTWMLTDLGVETPWTDLQWTLTLRSVGLGMAMMPIMTCGLSALPEELNSYGSAFNTMIQRVAAAIGLGGITALITLQQSQAFADRSGLMAELVVAPEQASSSIYGELGMVLTHRMVEAQAFVTALDDLMLTLTVLTALAVPLSLMLPSGRPAGVGLHVLEA